MGNPSVLAAAASATPGTDGALAIWTAPFPAPSGAAGVWTETSVKVPAWAASAQWGDQVVVAGGLLDGKPVADVALLKTAISGGVTRTSLPNLPKPLAGAGAAVIGTTLYVFGGVSETEPAQFEKTLWKLDLDQHVRCQNYGIGGIAADGAGIAAWVEWGGPARSRV